MGIPVTTTTNIWRAFYEEKLHSVGPYYFSLTWWERMERAPKSSAAKVLSFAFDTQTEDTKV